MSNEIIKVMTDFKQVIDDWNLRVTPTEEELLKQLTDLRDALSSALEAEKPKSP